MLKKSKLTITLGVAFGMLHMPYANAEEYANKYGSPDKAHKLYVKAQNLPSHSSEQFKMYDLAIKAGSIEAMLWSAHIFMHFTGGAENLEKGLQSIKPALSKNNTDINQYALIGYAWTGDQASARKILDLELAKPDQNKAKFVWNYARYTGNGFYNAPYEPKQVCDEAEIKFNTKTSSNYDAYLVGRCYFDGVVRTKDEVKGIKLFEQYQNELWEASDTLGILYTVGTKYTPQDFKKASDLMQMNTVSSFRRLPEVSYYAAIVNMNLGTNWMYSFDLLENAASYGNYQAQWILNKYPRMGNTRIDLKGVIKANPPVDPNLPKGSPRLPEFKYVNTTATASKSVLTPEIMKALDTSPRLLQVAAYLRAIDRLPKNHMDLQGCKEAQLAYSYGKFPDETDNVYEESAAGYAVCLATSKPFRALQKNPTQMGYKVVEDLMKRNYKKGFDLKQLYDNEFR